MNALLPLSAKDKIKILEAVKNLIHVRNAAGYIDLSISEVMGRTAIEYFNENVFEFFPEFLKYTTDRNFSDEFGYPWIYEEQIKRRELIDKVIEDIKNE